MSTNRFRRFQSVKILTGKYAGLAGSVLECRDGTSMVKLEIQGTLNDVVIDEAVWLKFEQVDAL